MLVLPNNDIPTITGRKVGIVAMTEQNARPSVNFIDEAIYFRFVPHYVQYSTIQNVFRLIDD